MLCHHKFNIEIKLNFRLRTIELDITHLSMGRSKKSKATRDSFKMESIVSYTHEANGSFLLRNNNKRHLVHHDTTEDSDVILTTKGTDIHRYFKFDVQLKLNRKFPVSRSPFLFLWVFILHTQTYSRISGIDKLSPGKNCPLYVSINWLCALTL